ncbi:hypothetical protein C8R43DRAFT_969402 [Mycena crocata]|nr:hypothetical protein C8R43DRAFT_969402 [Mycena crocata]
MGNTISKYDPQEIVAVHPAEIIEELQAIQPHQSPHIVYPILTLPSEITSEIFIRCLPSGLKEESKNPHPRLAPLLLLTICRTWRDIALSTPTLWAVLRLYIETDSTLGSYVDEVFENWLRRSGDVPLSLTLHGWCASFPTIIGRYATRLRCLDVKMYTGDFSHLPDTTAFPLLERFSFEYGRAIRSVGPPVPQNCLPMRALQQAPQLREVNFPCSVDSFFLYSDHFAFKGCVPWGQLTSINCMKLSTKEFLLVLRWAPLLVQCTISRNRRLESLTLHPCCTYFLEFVTLPALQSLCLRGPRDIDEHSFLQFLSRSSNPLRRFSCETWDPSACVSADAIHAMPKLTHLELGIVRGMFKDDLFRMLDREKEPDALPDLESIAISGFTGSVKQDVVQALLSRSVRNEGFAKLQSFSATTLDRHTPLLIAKAQLPHLSRLVAEGGMKIRIGTQTENFLRDPPAAKIPTRGADREPEGEFSAADPLRFLNFHPGGLPFHSGLPSCKWNDRPKN